MVLEYWKQIPKHEAYEASSFGRIRKSEDKSFLSQNILGGYFSVTIKTGYGKRAEKRMMVHRLVAMAFHGLPDEEKRYACHNDSNKYHNSSCNLRWDTQSGNLADRKEAGTEIIGTKNGKAVLDEEKVKKIKKIYSGKFGEIALLARKLNVSEGTVRNVVKGRTWSHVRV